MASIASVNIEINMEIIIAIEDMTINSLVVFPMAIIVS